MEAIVSAAAFERTLDFLEKLIPKHSEKFAESISSYLAFVMSEMQTDRATNLVILRLIDSLGVVTFAALQEMTAHLDSSIGDNVFAMRRQGILEQMEDGIYRIPPLLRDRLTAYLIDDATVTASTDALKRFANSVISVGSEDHGQIFLYNKIRAKLSAGVPATAHEGLFVSAAMLFREADSSYKARRYPNAFDLYRRTFVKIKQLRDIGAEIEVARFLGLCAARLNKKKEITIATDYLRHVSAKGMQDRAMGIADYVDGFHARLEEDYATAERCFRSGIKLMPDTALNKKGRSILLSELARVLVKTDPPQYSDAVASARHAVEIHYTAQNLSWLIHVLTQQTYRDTSVSQNQVQNNFDEIDQRLIELGEKCSLSSAMDYYDVRQAEQCYLAERERVREVKEVNHGSERPNYSDAIEWQQKAYERAYFADHLPQLWKLKYETFADGITRKIALANLISDLDQFISGDHQTRHVASAEYWKVVVLYELEGRDRAQTHLDRHYRSFSRSAVDKLRNLLRGQIVEDGAF